VAGVTGVHVLVVCLRLSLSLGLSLCLRLRLRLRLLHGGHLLHEGRVRSATHALELGDLLGGELAHLLHHVHGHAVHVLISLLEEDLALLLLLDQASLLLHVLLSSQWVVHIVLLHHLIGIHVGKVCIRGSNTGWHDAHHGWVHLAWSRYRHVLGHVVRHSSVRTSLLTRILRHTRSHWVTRAPGMTTHSWVEAWHRGHHVRVGSVEYPRAWISTRRVGVGGRGERRNGILIQPLVAESRDRGGGRDGAGSRGGKEGGRRRAVPTSTCARASREWRKGRLGIARTWRDGRLRDVGPCRGEEVDTATSGQPATAWTTGLGDESEGEREVGRLVWLGRGWMLGRRGIADLSGYSPADGRR
jgi:hypothetical protein